MFLIRLVLTILVLFDLVLNIPFNAKVIQKSRAVYQHRNRNLGKGTAVFFGTLSLILRKFETRSKIS